jgi:acyl-CoA synthetase (AMP-forming)/AMP-acid ligase II
MTIMTIDVGLGAMVRANEARHGDSIAYIDGDRSLTHRALGARARRLASAFHKHGCRHQDRVAILSMNCLEYGEVYAACEISGIITATVNFRLAAPEILATVNDSSAKILVFEESYGAIIDGLRARMPSVGTYVCIGNAPDWAVDYPSFIALGDPAGPPFTGTGDDIAAIMYTSGSTGRPKGCVIGQREFARTGQLVSGGMRMSACDRTALPMPLFHVGAKSIVAGTHWRGGTVVLLREFRPEPYLETIEKHRVTKGHLAPTLIQMLLELPNVQQYDLSSVSMIMYSASAMPVPVLRRAIALFGNVFQNGYGMSEGPATLLEPEQHKPDGTEKEQRRLQSVGTPYPNVHIRITRDDGTEAAVGEAGEICLKSDAMFRGYWNNSVATGETLRDGWYRSGDIGKLDEDGFLYLVDRKKDMIITGGENVYSREVEDMLLGHPGILEIAVIGVPDAKWGEAVCAIIVPRAGFEVTEAAVIDYSRLNIASYKKPRKVVFVTDLPKLPSGKVNKVTLRQLYASPYV